jgi:hypothetical protein
MATPALARPLGGLAIDGCIRDSESWWLIEMNVRQSWRSPPNGSLPKRRRRRNSRLGFPVSN